MGGRDGGRDGRMEAFRGGGREGKGGEKQVIAHEVRKTHREEK